MINIFFKKYNLYLIAGALSLLLTCVMLQYNQPINIDGLRYIGAAKAFFNQNIHSAIKISTWPFYSILIATLVNLTHFSFLNATYLLDAIFDAGTVILFLILIKEFGASKRVQYIATFIILFYPYLNHLRYAVVRGHGYYFFTFLAVLFFIKYCRSYKLVDAFIWGISIVFATLFRVEGVALALFLPFVLLFKPNLRIFSKCLFFIKAYSVHFIVIVSFIICTFLISHKFCGHYQMGGRLPYIINQLFYGFKNVLVALHAKEAILNKYIFAYPPSGKYSGQLFLIGGLIGLFLSVFLSTFGVVYAFLVGYAIKLKVILFGEASWQVWIFCVLINVIFIYLFAFQFFFLVNRYVALLCLLLLFCVPFALDHVYQSWSNLRFRINGFRWIYPLLLFGVLVTFIGSVALFGTSKSYLVNAGRWIKKNTSLNSRLYTNSPQLFFYASRGGKVQSPIRNREIHLHYNYFAFMVQRSHLHTEKNLSNSVSPPLKVFSNKRGDKVFIFKLKNKIRNAR